VISKSKSQRKGDGSVVPAFFFRSDRTAAPAGSEKPKKIDPPRIAAGVLLAWRFGRDAWRDSRSTLHQQHPIGFAPADHRVRS